MIKFILVGAIVVCLLLLVILSAIKVNKNTNKSKHPKDANTMQNGDLNYDGNEQSRLKQESQTSLEDAKRLSLSLVEGDDGELVAGAPLDMAQIEEAQKREAIEKSAFAKDAPTEEDLIVNEEDNLENHTFKPTEIKYVPEPQPQPQLQTATASPFMMQQEAEDFYQHIMNQLEVEAKNLYHQMADKLEEKGQTILTNIKSDNKKDPFVYPVGFGYMNDKGEINLYKDTKYIVRDGTDFGTNLYVVHSDSENVEMILFDTLFAVKNGENLALADGDEIVPLTDFTLTVDTSEE